MMTTSTIAKDGTNYSVSVTEYPEAVIRGSAARVLLDVHRERDDLVGDVLEGQEGPHPPGRP